MPYPVLQRELSIHLDNGRWAARSIDEQASDILGRVDYGWHRYNEYPDSFTFGEGLLAGSSIPVARRLVFCAFSPQWDGFHVSSMGGSHTLGTEAWERLGIAALMEGSHRHHLGYRDFALATATVDTYLEHSPPPLEYPRLASSCPARNARESLPSRAS